ncbi:MAG: hypothetical protein KDD55_07660 [Bdellovibrionales bacterium]|nr:hypothetical protein [Bdellovibrionales bacterium]
MFDSRNPGGLEPPSPSPDSPHQDTSSYITHVLEQRPDLQRVIHRTLLQRLIADGITTQHEIEKLAGIDLQLSDFPADTHERRWTREERQQLNQAIRELAAQHLALQEVEYHVGTAIYEATEYTLTDYVLDPVHKMTGPGLIEHLQSFCACPPSADPKQWNPESQLDEAEREALRVKLAQTLLTEDSKLVRVAQKLFSVSDYLEIAQQCITTDNGIGHIGGKMTGLLLTHKALTIDEDTARIAFGFDLEPDPHPDYLPLRKPEAVTLTAEDVFESVISLNNLHRYRMHKRLPLAEVKTLEEQTEAVFRNIDFPPDIERKLLAFVKRVEGQGPFMVRSSSLLEDSTNAPFSGIYDSVVFTNIGTAEERLEQLKAAIGEVYASTYTEKAVGYRKRFAHLDLFDREENMGVTIQRMVGLQVGKYFITPMSGVGFSYNDEIPDETYNPEDGIVTVAMGNGKAIVDPNPENPTRDLHLTRPHVRLEREHSVDAIAAASQRYVFAVDMEQGKFIKKDIFELQREVDFPLEFVPVLSCERDGRLTQGISRGGVHHITFDCLSHDNRFTEKMKWAFRRLRSIFGHEVDIELASDFHSLTILQGRRELEYTDAGFVSVPKNLSPEQTVIEISGEKMTPTCSIEDISHIVSIDPRGYTDLFQGHGRSAVLDSVSKVVDTIRQLNDQLPKGKFIIMGPGRWGTNMDESLYGIPVDLAHISNAALLIERVESGDTFHFASASGGAHWRSGLKMVDLRVLPLYPQREGTTLSPSIFSGENTLAQWVLPDRAEQLKDVIHVVDVAKETEGRLLHFASNRQERRAALWVK